MKSVLVTGGAGFIGSHLVRGLLNKGYRVSVLDNLLTGKEENLEEVRKDLQGFHLEDIRDPAVCRQATKGMDAVLHQAALPSVPRSIEDPVLSNEINVNGTLNMLSAALANGVRRFVFASSSSVYGDTPTLPKKEDMTPNPLSPYALQKLTGEYYTTLFSSLYGLESVSLRYFNIFGPRQDPTSQYAAVIPIFITALTQDTPAKVFGDGEQSRDFTFVDNVVKANISAIEVDSLGGEVVNIACGQRYTLNELLELLGAEAGRRIPRDYAERRAGDVLHSLADISKAEMLLNYEVTVPFEEGLRATYESFM